jgi:hypothetical protein
VTLRLGVAANLSGGRVGTWGETIREREKKKAPRTNFVIDFAHNMFSRVPCSLLHVATKGSDFIKLATSFIAPLEISFFY